MRSFILLLTLCVGLLAAHETRHVEDEVHDPAPPHLKYSREANEKLANTSLPSTSAEEAQQQQNEEEIALEETASAPTSSAGAAEDVEDTVVPDIELDSPEEPEKNSTEPHEERGGFLHNNITYESVLKEVVKQLDEHEFQSSLTFLNVKRTRLWTLAVGATLLVGILPCLLLCFIPVKANEIESASMLKVLLAFGAGGLLGDAFFHLIPHSMPAHAHGHGADHGEKLIDLSSGMTVLTGFLTFFIAEKLVRVLRSKCIYSYNPNKDTGAIAILNLAADFLHNFTDGLAIGASFGTGTSIGIVTTMTVLVHEVPHEIGDFAILVQNGFSKKDVSLLKCPIVVQAMLLQVMTAMGAVGGCVFALWLANPVLAGVAATSSVLPFTAGGFIYIATVSIIPELLEKSRATQSLKEIIALLAGISLMYYIALCE